MDFPKNCELCEHRHNCISYYGGSMCKHKNEINREAIKKILNKQ